MHRLQFSGIAGYDVDAIVGYSLSGQHGDFELCHRQETLSLVVEKLQRYRPTVMARDGMLSNRIDSAFNVLVYVNQ